MSFHNLTEFNFTLACVEEVLPVFICSNLLDSANFIINQYHYFLLYLIKMGDVGLGGLLLPCDITEPQPVHTYCLRPAIPLFQTRLSLMYVVTWQNLRNLHLPVCNTLVPATQLGVLDVIKSMTWLAVQWTNHYEKELCDYFCENPVGVNVSMVCNVI